jgi:hypothetical protein
MNSMHEPLNFPREVRVRDARGRPVSEEYVIPLNAKKAVLDRLSPFVEKPELTEELFDLHEEKKFLVADFKVVRENGLNLLVSPYYYSSGGTIIDWVPADWADD